MVEIACPNCNARYQVPAEALGAAGREVACSSCGTVWHARPMAAETPRPQPAPVSPQPAPPVQPAVDGGDRSREMAKIREMLDEVQNAERRRAVPPAPSERDHAAERWSGESAPPLETRTRPRAVDIDDEVESLRDAVGQSSGRSSDMRDTDTSRERMMRSHTQRYEEQEERSRRRSGAGYTAFLLVVLVSAVLIGLYALHPQIIARAPAFEPALTNYVAAVESLRADLESGYQMVAGMIAEQTGGQSGG